jgi:capsular polysaccharide biosynthesis protein
MKTINTMLLSATLLLGMAVLANAQTPAPTPGTKTPVARKRQHIQQKRIVNGVESGELKAGEVQKLENQHHEVKEMKQDAKADGTVTHEERKDIQKEQNQTSRQIYRAKHNNRKRN